LAGKLGNAVSVVGGGDSTCYGFCGRLSKQCPVRHPGCNVLVNYADTFIDPDLGAQMAQDIIDNGGANVIFGGASPLGWVLQDVDWDGDMDLLFHFNTLKLRLTGSNAEAVLTGKTFDGIFVDGVDTVKIVPAK